MTALRYLSVCSGIEAASVAWHPLGWQLAGVAEIEPFPAHVLHHRFGAGRPMFMPSPDAVRGASLRALKDRRARANAIRSVARIPEAGAVPNFGDLNQFLRWPDADVDVLVGGTPCQSFSVAGLRQGLRDPRGNLALVYLALADRYRPRWVVWENVPGVLSSGEGRDFGAFLGGAGRARVWVRLPSSGRSIRANMPIWPGGPPAKAPCVRCRISWRLAPCRSGII